MTVTYTAQVASCKRFGCFWKLLFRWKGSIYKLLWPNLIVYIMMYSTLSFCYRFLLDEEQQATFEKLSLHCQTYGDLIPVSFVLGFYISIVVKRWWDQYLSIPWPDPLAILVSAFICGQDERSRVMRRTIMRYANLSLVITLRMMCPTVKKRFPTMDHMVEAGFMLPKEKKIFDKLEEKTPHSKYWLPLVWSIHIINTARREDKIKDEFGLTTIINSINKFRAGCGGLLNYDWISIPLVYTQVVTLAVYTYFLATLMGNQYLNPKKGYVNHSIDLVVPIFTLLQFFFYMGWLLVAETLVNPFGEDDDDFEVNWLIDRNLQVSYIIVDEVHEDYPELVRDQYWEEVVPTELPYTEAAKQYYTEPFLGSTRDVDVPLDQRGFVLMSMLNEFEPCPKPVCLKERKETTPVRIKPILTSNALSHHSTPFGDGRSNSIMNLLHKNIYGDDSKRSISSSDLSNTRRKSVAFSRVSGSAGYSVASTFRRNNDFPDDIFYMSDFSLSEPRQKFYKYPLVANESETGPLISEETVPSILKTNLKTQSAYLNTQQNEKIKQSMSWHGREFSELSQGKGELKIKNIGLLSNMEQCVKNKLNSRSKISVISHRSDSGRYCTERFLEPVLMNSSENILNDNSSDETVKEVIHEKEIVPLDEQILLEEAVNLTPKEPKDNVEIINESVKKCSLKNQDPADVENSPESVCDPGVDVITEPSFEQMRSPAITIPGSISLNDHLSLPVIEHETPVVESPINQSINENQSFLDDKTNQNTIH